MTFLNAFSLMQALNMNQNVFETCFQMPNWQLALILLTGWCHHATSHYLQQWWPITMSVVHILSCKLITVTSHERHKASNHQWLDGCFNSLFRLASKIDQISGLLITHEGNRSVIDGLPSQRASNAESVSILGHHHVYFVLLVSCTSQPAVHQTSVFPRL